MGLVIVTILLLAFALLALYDGFYLHIFKYELFNHPESKFEHLTHTIRAVLFPFIVYFLFLIQNSEFSFFIGIFLVIIDLMVLGIDAYVEKDSRRYMGGLPRSEYILHLFVNGFHFASIAVFLAIKLSFTASGVVILPSLSGETYFEIFRFVAINLLPGAIFMALIHLVTSFEFSKGTWNACRAKITCC